MPTARKLDRVVPLAVLGGALVVVAVGLTIRATQGGLGTALPPFVMNFGIRVHPLALVSVVAAVLAAVAAPRLLDVRWRPPAVAAALYAGTLGLGLALALLRWGAAGPSRIFDLGPEGSFEAKNEALPGLPALDDGVRLYLDRFSEIGPSQPVNVIGHPPGQMVLLHGLGIDSAGGFAALCIGAVALCAPLAYLLARVVLDGDETRARTAGVLTALAPSLLLFGVTSPDGLFAALFLLAVLALVVPRTRALGCLLFVVAGFFSWAALAAGAIGALLVWQREGLRAAAVLAAGCGVALVAFHASLAAAIGWDPIGTLVTTEQVYRLSAAAERPYAFWVFGSATAWLLMAGLPTAWHGTVALARRHPMAAALVVVVLISAVGGFTKAETERIWLQYVPLLAVAAAAVVPLRAMRWLAPALVVQALATQALFDTIW